MNSSKCYTVSKPTLKPKVNLTRQEYHNAVDAYSARLFRFAFKVLRNTDDARDIVQDCYQRLWENRNEVLFEKCRQWLFTVAHNAMMNLLKRQNRVKLVENYQHLDMPGNEQQYDLRELLDKCLAELPAVQQSVVLLRDLEGYDYQEIGNILSLNESQVKVYLFRARQKIKNYIKDLTVLSDE